MTVQTVTKIIKTRGTKLCVKTIGAVIIDSGVFKASGIKQELYIINDWASDGLVLQLFLADG